MRSEGYSSCSVCLFVCLSVDDYSRTTGYEAAYERYQQLQCYKGMKINVAILLKRLRSRDMANMHNQHWTSITCTAAPRVWHFSAFHYCRHHYVSYMEL